MDALFKPCERLKLLVMIKKLLPRETTRLFTSDDPGSRVLHKVSSRLIMKYS